MRAHRSFLVVFGALAGALPGSLAAAGPVEAQLADYEATQPAELGAANDPNLDRGFLLPTAMTQPAGSVTYNNYELLLHGLTFGVNDRLQISGTVLAPITEDFPLLGTAALKAQVYRGRRLHLAVQGSFTYATFFGDEDDHQVDDVDDDADDAFFAGGLGLLASACLSADCRSLLSASATYQRLWTSDDGDLDADTLVYGASLVQGLGRHVKLLLEVSSAALGQPLGGDRDLYNLRGVLASYGVRFHGERLAADVGLMKPVAFDGDNDDGLLLGLPFANLSYRW